MRKIAYFAAALMLAGLFDAPQAQVVRPPTGVPHAPIPVPTPAPPPTAPSVTPNIIVTPTPPLNETIVKPPPPAPPAPLDAGDGSSPCDCYVTENVPQMIDGQVVMQSTRRWTGKHPSCCAQQ